MKKAFMSLKFHDGEEDKKKIDDLQTENKNLKAKLNQLLAMVKTNEY